MVKIFNTRHYVGNLLRLNWRSNTILTPKTTEKTSKQEESWAAACTKIKHLATYSRGGSVEMFLKRPDQKPSNSSSHQASEQQRASVSESPSGIQATTLSATLSSQLYHQPTLCYSENPFCKHKQVIQKTIHTKWKEKGEIFILVSHANKLGSANGVQFLKNGVDEAETTPE